MSGGSVENDEAALGPTVGHPGLAPSAWVRRWSHLVAPNGRVLDVACGAGRHLRWFAERGCRVTGVDRDADAMAQNAAIGQPGGTAECIVADMESGPWPIAGRVFDAVVVTNYLWRARLPDIIASVGPSGVLIYETFAAGQEAIGRPSNPDFLLRPGELIAAVQGHPHRLRVIAFEEGMEQAPRRVVQRIVAVNEAGDETGRKPAAVLLSQPVF